VEDNARNDEAKPAAEESKPSAAEEARKAVAACSKRRELVRHNCKCKKSKW